MAKRPRCNRQAEASFAKCEQRSAAESLTLAISIHLSELCLQTCTTPTVMMEDFNPAPMVQSLAGYGVCKHIKD